MTSTSTTTSADELAALAELLAGARDRRAACSALVRALVPSVATWCTLHALEDTRQVALLAAAHADAGAAQRLRDEERRRLRDLSTLPAGDLEAGCLVARVLRGGAPRRVVVREPDDCVAVAGDVERGALLQAIGTTSLLALPLRTRDEGGVDAVLTLGRVRAAAPFGDEDEAHLVRVARVAGVALRALARVEAAEQAHADADARRQRVVATFEAITEGFVMLDRQWHVTWVNRAASTLLGAPRTALLGRDGRLLLPGGDDLGLREQLVRAMHTGSAVEFEARRDDAWVEVRAYATPEGLSVHLRDVSERHRNAAQMEALLARAEAARHDAEAANQTKADFLASMSHELRTPLNAILGYVSLLADGISGPVSAGQVQQLTRVSASARHLLSLIEEILSFARLESGREETTCEPVDAAVVAAEVARLIEPVIASHGLRFDVALPDVPVPLHTDARKVRQMLLNLLANAGRFTPPGGVVALALAPAADGGARFTVRDTGIGIAPEHHERIFEPFWQVEQSRTRRVGGTGLGLSVTRRYARLLGGDVTVESAPGQGSTFTVALPREAPAVPEAVP